MSEHLIHFRRAWVATPLGPAAPAGRVDLPTAWPPDLAGPFRLSRSFGRPPIDPARERLRLRFDRVEGLIRMALNGMDLGPPPTAGGAFDRPLDWAQMAARNELAIEVDPSRWLGPVEDWGHVGLLIVAE